MLGINTLDMVVNREGEYAGLYVAHPEAERIVIATAKFLGVTYAEESWLPRFPQGFSPLAHVDCVREPQGRLFTIRFLGTPEENKVCGYQGCCRRMVKIRKVFDFQEVTSSDA